MPEKKYCEKYERCPIFTGALKGKEFTTKAYVNTYCSKAPEGPNKCKRYLVSNIMGKVPPALLPNSRKSVEDIIAQMKAEEK